MRHLCISAAAAALLVATGASAQVSPNFEPSAENCAKAQYSTTAACKSFLEGRSSDTEGGTAPLTSGKEGDNAPAGSSAPSSGGNSGGSGAGGSGGSN